MKTVKMFVLMGAVAFVLPAFADEAKAPSTTPTTATTTTTMTTTKNTVTSTMQAAKTAPAKAQARVAGKWQDMKMLTEHLTNHCKYPATKTELTNCCNSMTDINTADKTNFSTKLPEGTYASAAEVLSALNK
jgi:hypothetical protein